jgi:hypothetical protein
MMVSARPAVSIIGSRRRRQGQESKPCRLGLGIGKANAEESKILRGSCQTRGL